MPTAVLSGLVDDQDILQGERVIDPVERELPRDAA